MMKRPLCLFVDHGLWVIAAIIHAFVVQAPTTEAAPAQSVLRAEAKRIETIERVIPSVVCIYNSNKRGGGSGVLIAPDGYGLTNYHVVAAMLGTRKGWGGLGDGVLYELEVLGIDVTGDVAMFRLVPPSEPYVFPYAELGDSDRVEVGDIAIAMGNPFILSEDYSPSVTLGIVTGTHRYQWGVKGNLAYTDCLQVDTAINPGNSGGPLFNEAGEVIGINGRISVNTRGRFNVGFGYAISSNQIKRFLPALRAGLLAKHGTWQAQVEDVEGSGAVFTDARDPGPTFEAGIRAKDRLWAIDDIPIQSANHVASILGTYPAGWPVRLTTQRNDRRHDSTIRLDPVMPRMRRPFKPQEEVNQRQVRRVLNGFRRAVLGDRADVRPTRWQWSVTQRRESENPDSKDTNRRYDAWWDGTGAISMRENVSGQPSGLLVEFTDERATQKANPSADAFDLSTDEKMVLGAVYVFHKILQSPADELDLSVVKHIGGDAWVMLEAGQGADGEARRKVDSGTEQILEIIEWPLGDDATAQLAFDAQTALLLRARVRDRLSSSTATLYFQDYVSDHGMLWPHTLNIRARGMTRRDIISDLKVTP